MSYFKINMIAIDLYLSKGVNYSCQVFYECEAYLIDCLKGLGNPSVKGYYPNLTNKPFISAERNIDG